MAVVKIRGHRFTVVRRKTNMFELRILVIEDNPENMDLICLILERENHEIYKAYDGQSGIELAYQHHPDLILLDLALPVKDGWSVAAELKSDIIMQAIPIIAVSAHTLPEFVDKAYQAGCSGFLTKPFRLNEFNEIIQKFS